MCPLISVQPYSIAEKEDEPYDFPNDSSHDLKF